MSTNGSSRVRRSPLTRVGPLKATLPVSSTWGTTTALTSSTATVKSATSLHQGSSSVPPPPPQLGVLLSGLRSPGAVNYRGKCKTLSGRALGDYSTASMRRTASLDTIYLNGQWPSEGNLYMGNLLVDRSTQTEELVGESRKIKHQDSISNEEKLEKFIRHRVQRSALAGGGPQPLRTSTVSTTTTVPFYCLLLSEAAASLGGGGRGSSESLFQRHKMRSSIEGLNQEIERLVLKANQPVLGGSGDCQERKVSVENTPEGHRAPVADLLRQTRSVNTQTPAYTHTSSAQSSGPPSRCSGSPLSSAATNPSDSRPTSGCCDRDRGGGISEDSSPETEGSRHLGTSPRINKFLAREPPDGCERVCLKFQEDNRKPMVDISEMDYPLKPSVNFQLKPSLGSAFQPLKSTQ